MIKIIDAIKDIMDYTIKRVFLIVYPPYGEEELSQVDIRIGLITDKNLNSLYTLCTNMEDLWSPIISKEQIPTTFFNELEFKKRTNKWMSEELNDDIVLEYYDFTKSVYFKDIVGQKVSEIELLNIKNNPEPFGVKIIFENDFILSFPSFDGNTIETKTFNKNDNIENFNYLGNVIYSTIGSAGAS